MASAIAAVQPVHVAIWIEAGTRELATPSIKQWLAAIRHLFDWLVSRQTGDLTKPNNHVKNPGTRALATEAESRQGGTVQLHDRQVLGTAWP